MTNLAVNIFPEIECDELSTRKHSKAEIIKTRVPIVRVGVCL